VQLRNTSDTDPDPDNDTDTDTNFDFDGLRALCAAAWTQEDKSGPVEVVAARNDTAASRVIEKFELG
jgi:hypothetical protein